MLDWFHSVACFLFKESNMLMSYFPISFLFLTSLWPHVFHCTSVSTATPRVPQLSWARALHKAGVEGLKLQLCLGTAGRWTDVHEPLSVQLTQHSQTFKYIVGVFAAGVCSDQKRRNPFDHDGFFLKEKQKRGQKIGGLSSRLLKKGGGWSKLQLFDWARGTG